MYGLAYKSSPDRQGLTYADSFRHLGGVPWFFFDGQIKTNKLSIIIIIIIISIVVLYDSILKFLHER